MNNGILKTPQLKYHKNEYLFLNDISVQPESAQKEDPHSKLGGGMETYELVDNIQSQSDDGNPSTLVQLAQLISKRVSDDTRDEKVITKRIKIIESRLSSLKDEIRNMRKRKRKERKKRKTSRKKRRNISSSDDDSESESDRDDPRDKQMMKEGKIITDLPVELLARIFTYLRIGGNRVYSVCRVFRKAYDSNGMWNVHLLSFFNNSGGNASPWISYTTTETKGIYTLNSRSRSLGYEVGFEWASSKEKFRRSVQKLESQFTVTRLLDSCMKSFNVIPCVMIDPELGMKNTFLARSRFSKKVLLGSHLENGTHPLTILYIVINRTRSNRGNFEAKVICVDKRFEAPATKKMHRNDVFEGIMRMLAQARSSMAFNAPYWDATESLKVEQYDNKITEMRKSLDKYDPLTDITMERRNKADESKHKSRPTNSIYMFKPYSGCPSISASANESGYVIVNNDTFSDVSYAIGTDTMNSINGKYFREGSLWTNENAWYWPATRFILGYKCRISNESLHRPDLLLKTCLNPKKDHMSPIPMDAESLSLDLQVIQHTMQGKLGKRNC